MLAGRCDDRTAGSKSQMKNFIVLLSFCLIGVACTFETGNEQTSKPNENFSDKAEQVSALASQANTHIQS